MKKSVKIKISGIVQGIFFRQFIKENADKLSMKGYVRNIEKGEVEAIFEGDKDNVEKMIELCKTGPAHSVIKDIKLEERNYSGDFKDFKILRF
ncbi:MAG: acylphosphatase [Nanoarchaeota archaeon]